MYDIWSAYSCCQIIVPVLLFYEIFIAIILNFLCIIYIYSQLKPNKWVIKEKHTLNREYSSPSKYSHKRFLVSYWQGDIASCSGTYLYLWSINGEEIACVNTAPPQNNQQILCLAMSQVHVTTGGAINTEDPPKVVVNIIEWLYGCWFCLLCPNVNCFLTSDVWVGQQECHFNRK